MVNLYDIQQLMSDVARNGQLGYRGTGQLMSALDKVWRALNAWVDEYKGNVLGFQHDWVRARLFVPLQIRLAMEQILYERGGAYRTLVSGFGPADVPGGAAGQGGSPTGGPKGSDKISYSRVAALERQIARERYWKKKGRRAGR